MKCKLTTYAHSENGVSLILEGETEVEKELLRGLWKHGKLATGTYDHMVEWKFEKPKDVPK